MPPGTHGAYTRRHHLIGGKLQIFIEPCAGYGDFFTVLPCPFAVKKRREGNNVVCPENRFDISKLVLTQIFLVSYRVIHAVYILQYLLPPWRNCDVRAVRLQLLIDLGADIEGDIKRLRDAGVDVLTIADCPIARARMDSSLLACKVRRELEMDVLPHMTCRDRNLNATKALLLGLYAESVRNVLLVTGDPIPTAERDEVKSVYQFNSRKLAAFVSELGRQTLPGGFHIFGALNINARNFDVQLKLARQKIEKGMVGFLTQPVLTETAVENLKRAKEELDAYLLGGLIPIVSERNARFMDSEVNGVSVSQEIIKAYEGKNRAESEDLAVEITLKIARQIGPYVDGYYIVTPFNRTSLIERIVGKLEK